jgi:hypothetical protein
MKFITDFGEELILRDPLGQEVTRTPRYGFWTDEGSHKGPQVGEVSNDLEYLRGKYGDCDLIPVSMK